MYKDRTEQRRVTETMSSLLIPMLQHLNNDTAIIVKRALYLLGEIEIEPQEKRCADCNHYGKLSLDCGRCDDDCSMFEPQEGEKV